MATAPSCARAGTSQSSAPSEGSPMLIVPSGFCAQAIGAVRMDTSGTRARMQLLRGGMQIAPMQIGDYHRFHRQLWNFERTTIRRATKLKQHFWNGVQKSYDCADCTTSS